MGDVYPCSHGLCICIVYSRDHYIVTKKIMIVQYSVYPSRLFLTPSFIYFCISCLSDFIIFLFFSLFPFFFR